VIITDHHLPGRQLPEADAIINPNQPDDNFPSKNLSVVVLPIIFPMLPEKKITSSKPIAPSIFQIVFISISSCT